MKPFSILTMVCTTFSLLTACSPFSSSINNKQEPIDDAQSPAMVRQDGPYLDDMDEDSSAVELRVSASSASSAAL